MEPSLRGPYDQAPLDDRHDVLRFLTSPFTERTEITGPIRAELYAASSAPDTDFMAKLVVVKPNGVAFNLVDGVIRARYREGRTQTDRTRKSLQIRYRSLGNELRLVAR